MVVAVQRVAKDTLVLDSYALSPTILAGTNPQPHPLLMSSTLVTLLLVLFNYQVILRGISTKSQFTMGFIPCCLDQLCILFPAKKEKERPVLGFCSWITDWVTTSSGISNSNPNKKAICSKSVSMTSTHLNGYAIHNYTWTWLLTCQQAPREYRKQFGTQGEPKSMKVKNSKSKAIRTVQENL